MIQLEEKGSVTILRMERGKGNAFNLEFAKALHESLESLERSNARAIVLTGKDNSFCAGVDLLALVEGGPDYVRNYVPAMHACFEKLARFPKPVVAAVNGHAIAGGAVIMLACDQKILAHGSARIGLTEVLVGVPFPSWALEVPRFAVPTQHLSKVVCTGRTWLPEDAFNMGLVDEVVQPDKLIERAVEVAEEMAVIDLRIFTLTKLALREPMISAAMERADRTNAAVVEDWASPSTLAKISEFARQKIQSKNK